VFQRHRIASSGRHFIDHALPVGHQAFDRLACFLKVIDENLLDQCPLLRGDQTAAFEHALKAIAQGNGKMVE
jgi:hypothetical protein